ncbi:M48 family metalloprotease [Phytoactinopolyspora halotolerans]|uniref:M48 family metalloprotease n=1 Tax=Phytoactinopolyspora halotolerans TaxID=1981512 RepID=A0A6L9SDL2_9ACTN|nr:M48 family metalloprotease [Phytoactinopolyspora halotolerans]NEE02120.1 M48 family metalloprotease [Phytoactinopolyspora halotolerans]
MTAAARFRPDRRLTFRIGETWLLLLVVTAGYGALIGLVLQWLVGLPWWIGLVLPMLATVLFYAQHDGGVLPRTLRTTDADPAREPRLYAVLERLCALADVPPPRVKVIDAEWTNALAVQLPGRRPVIAVSRGLLDTADDDRLESVLAHELAHVIHRDATVMTFAANTSTAVLTLPAHLVDVFYAADRALCWLARRCGFGWQPIDHDADDERLPARNVAAGLRTLLGCTAMPVIGLIRALLVLSVFPFGIVTLPAILVLSIPAVLVLTRLSRYREFAADRTAAMLTGRPTVLAATLTSLDEDSRRIPNKDLRELRAASSMAIVPLPVKHEQKKGQPRVSALERAVASHPPIGQRVKRLDELSRGLAQ